MRLRRTLLWIVALLILWFLVHITVVSIDGLNDYKGNADVAVVLGNAVYKDSSLSPWLKGRVDEALLLYREGRVPRIMVSGGKGTEKGYVWEGRAMKRYLLQQGVPADRIIEDNDGENTYWTAKDYLPVADSLHLSKVIVVSSFYHITRTKYIFRHLGCKNVFSAHSTAYFWNDIMGLAREFPAYYKYRFAY